MRLASKAILILLAFVIGGMALYGVVVPSAQSPVFKSLLGGVVWAGHAHVIFGSLALFLGAIQMSSRLRRKNIKLHRLIGNAYLGCVLAATTGAIVSLPVSASSLAAKSAFWLLAILWPLVTLAGYPWGERFCIRRHGKLMLFSYALTCSAITLRLILISLLASGVSFQVAYPISAWGALIGNTVFAAIVILLFDSKVSTVQSAS